jgi:hypothetical protein
MEEHPKTTDHIKYLSFAGIIAGLAVAYYFAIALPNQNRANLNFQEQQYQDQQNSQQSAAKQVAQDKAQRSLSLTECMSEAQDTYNSSFQLNSTPVYGKTGVSRWNSLIIQNNTEAKLKNDKDLCVSEYGGN